MAADTSGKQGERLRGKDVLWMYPGNTATLCKHEETGLNVSI